MILRITPSGTPAAADDRGPFDATALQHGDVVDGQPGADRVDACAFAGQDTSGRRARARRGTPCRGSGGDALGGAVAGARPGRGVRTYSRVVSSTSHCHAVEGFQPGDVPAVQVAAAVSEALQRYPLPEPDDGSGVLLLVGAGGQRVASRVANCAAPRTRGATGSRLCSHANVSAPLCPRGGGGGDLVAECRRQLAEQPGAADRPAHLPQRQAVFLVSSGTLAWGLRVRRTRPEPGSSRCVGRTAWRPSSTRAAPPATDALRVQRAETVALPLRGAPHAEAPAWWPMLCSPSTIDAAPFVLGDAGRARGEPLEHRVGVGPFDVSRSQYQPGIRSSRAAGRWTAGRGCGPGAA